MRDLDGSEDARDLRMRDAYASLSEAMGDGASCPGPDDLWNSARGKPRRRRQEAIVLHLGECASCAAAWRLARDLLAGEERAAEGAGVLSWARRFWIPATAAAALLLVVGGLLVRFDLLRRESPSEYRAQDSDWIRPVEGAESLPRGRCLLRWTPGPNGTIYDVRVMTEDLDPVARGQGMDRPEFLVPSPALDRVPSGSKIVWQVIAYLPDGRRSDSRTFGTEIR